MSTLAAALAWAARGFRIFPLRPNSKNSPVLGEGWPQYASNDAAQVRAWWTDGITGQGRDYNIATLADDLCIVDLDVRGAVSGVDTFNKIGGGPHTLTVQSPSGGYHLYYAPPRPVAGNQGASGFGEGVDVRGWHGFALAPGSSIDGRPYSLVADVPIAPMPEHFWPYLREPGERRALAERPAAVELDTDAAVQAATDYLTRAKPAIQGQHGDYRTLQVAMECRDLGVSAAACLDLMLEHFNERCEPPWDADELAVKVENAYLYAENQAGGKAAAAQFAGVVPMEPVPLVPATPAPIEHVNGYRPFQFGTVLSTGQHIARQWIIERMLERGEITALIAPGGIGKSQFVLSVAAFLAVGASDIFGFTNRYAGRIVKSVIYNAEDNIQEMSKRLAAFCSTHEIDEAAILPHISLTSGRDFKLSIATGGQVVERNDDHVGVLASAALHPEIAMLSVDPLSKIHTGNPNDNRDMNIVMDILAFITTRADVGTMAPMHTSKPGMASANAYAGNVNSALGATAVADSARIAFTLMGPTDEDIVRYGIPEHDRHLLLRLDDAKMNRTLRSGRSTWLEKHTVRLHVGDDVGSFKLTNIGDRAEAIRQSMGATIRNEFDTRGTAHGTIMETVAALQRGDPIYEHLPISAVKGRIERFLATPIELFDGGVVQIEVDGNNKTVAIS